MFDDLQKLFRESVEAFRSEFEKRDPEDEVARLLMSMRREMVEVRALIPKLEEDLASARRELAVEQERLAATERRGKLAEGIGDAETVKVAGEFAGRHRERVAVLAQKVAAAEAEIALRRRESDEMMRQYKEADLNRWALVARLRQGRIPDEVEEPSVSEFDEVDVEERLRELKRKMGEKS